MLMWMGLHLDLKEKRHQRAPLLEVVLLCLM